MADRLTSKQSEVLWFVQDYIESEGYPPTRREIAEAMNYRSENSAYDHLIALDKKGCIELRRGVSRGIRVVRTPWS